MREAEIADLRARTDEACFDGEGINVTKEDVERVLLERDALLVALKKIQWSGHSGVGHGDPGFNLCPECKAASPDSGWRNAGRHEAGCSIGTAIAKAEG